MKKTGKWILTGLLAVCLILSGTAGCLSQQGGIRIGVSSVIHEQILGWMVRELAVRQGIEAHIREVAPGIANIQPALESDSLQVGIEYSQNAWKNVLLEKSAYQAGDLGVLQTRYKKLGLHWMELPMVQDHYSLAVSRHIAIEKNLETLSDLTAVSDTLILGAPTAFFEEQDGYPLLDSHYGMKFRSTRNLSSDMLVEAVLRDKVDVIPAHSLDGHLAGTDFVILEDDRQVHDDTMAGIVVTDSALMEYPQLAAIAQELGRTLTASQLSLAAYNVVLGNETPQEAALQLLKSNDLIYEVQ